MAINKVIDRNNNVLIDLTNDTVSPNKVLAGTVFHGPDGKEYTGQIQPNELDSLKYNFIDYDGILMYSFTDEEIDAMTELPAGPDHTEDNLTFEGWNWTLEQLKSFNRDRITRPIIGACLITSDEKTYITIKTTSNNRAETFCFGVKNRKIQSSFDIDWGDGTQETVTTTSSSSSGEYYQNKNHTFPAADTEYTVIITPKENSDNLTLGTFYSGGIGQSDSFYGALDIKVGRIGGIGRESRLTYSNVRKMNIPLNTPVYKIGANVCFMDAIIIPDMYNASYALESAFHNCSAKIISFPGSLSLTNAGSFTNFFFKTHNLEFFTFPDEIELGSQASASNFVSDVSFNVLDLSSLPIVSYSDQINYIKTMRFNGATATISTQSRHLKDIIIPNTTTTISGFSYTFGLRKLVLPDSITKISSSCFGTSNICFTLDLSQQTKVIALTSSIGLSTSSTYKHKILVPTALLDAYKSASYWSSYASIMVGV